MTASGPGKQSQLIRDDASIRDGYVQAEMDRADEGGLVIRLADEDTSNCWRSATSAAAGHP
jgi:hypothetical protein